MLWHDLNYAGMCLKGLRKMWHSFNYAGMCLKEISKMWHGFNYAGMCLKVLRKMCHGFNYSGMCLKEISKMWHGFNYAGICLKELSKMCHVFNYAGMCLKGRRKTAKTLIRQPMSLQRLKHMASRIQSRNATNLTATYCLCFLLAAKQKGRVCDAENPPLLRSHKFKDEKLNTSQK